MSFRIERSDGSETKVRTASKAVDVVKQELRRERLVTLKLEPETSSPAEVTASQAEIESRQRH
ncbi:hypothetical protein M0654_04390 [Rhizobium sp. NTR19]|uniref:Uncharacterized protein n=1 Tax=Neorhizobium turbinariae TaxID=2937795 RepID=A0ABT0IMZ4_9HYPH|nr:hypothetical protein [Neorhizobium turbinariae]MCK8779218.1 hypothetical protein [Neorhizobium turbinariae]